MDIRAKLNDLPDSPGVYIMRDIRGTIIYIGKAVVLKNRVRQYFNNSPKEPKVAAMVSNITDFEYIITRTEKDALALESNLIKKHKPRYNILLKDDKSAPYIKCDLSHEYPCFEITRKIKADGARYFGPFMGMPARQIISVLQVCFNVRPCNKEFTKNQRECLNYHIGLCSAPCTKRIDRDGYRACVDQAIAFLSGQHDAAQRLIEQKMIEASENEQFERAITYRDQLNMLNSLKIKTVADIGRDVNADFFYYVSNGLFGAVSVVILRGGKMMGAKNFFISDGEVFGEENLSGFLTQYYSLNNLLPENICMQREFDTEPLKAYFMSSHSKRVNITFPKTGQKLKLLLTAKANAEDYIVKVRSHEDRRYDMTVGACRRLAELLKIDNARRMECYDISNISGVDKVASMVVFTDGSPEKSEYRRFKIKTVEGSDDFASMNEVISRRLARLKEGSQGFEQKPDLIIIDGGKGQLSAAMRAAEEQGISVNMISLAKREEEIFMPDCACPVILEKADYALKLLQRIRDEAHRFAITYHRTLRSHRYESELNSIKGIGAKKAKKLLEAFTYQQLKQAEVSELCAVVDRAAAQCVYDYYHETDN